MYDKIVGAMSGDSGSLANRVKPMQFAAPQMPDFTKAMASYMPKKRVAPGVRSDMQGPGAMPAAGSPDAYAYGVQAPGGGTGGNPFTGAGSYSLPSLMKQYGGFDPSKYNLQGMTDAYKQGGWQGLAGLFGLGTGGWGGQ